MEYKLVADSCCDVTPELRQALNLTLVPLTLTLGERSFSDDESLNLPAYMEQMKAFQGKVGSACPSPQCYKEAFLGGEPTFAVTLSSNLSASYSSAVLGKTMAEEEGADVHVFDSKSASAGELLVVLKLKSLLDAGMQKLEVIPAVEQFIQKMKTYFVLENLDNLIKNGRMGKLAGKLVSMVHIKPIMGSDGDGNIAFFSYARGAKQLIARLVDTIEKSGRKTDGENLVITHCNNKNLAEQLKEVIASKFFFQEILIVPTRGVSSLYANQGGIVMAY